MPLPAGALWSAVGPLSWFFYLPAGSYNHLGGRVPVVNSDTCGFLQRPRNQEAYVYRIEAFLVLSGGATVWVTVAGESICKARYLPLAPHPQCAPPATCVSEGKPPHPHLRIPQLGKLLHF